MLRKSLYLLLFFFMLVLAIGCSDDNATATVTDAEAVAAAKSALVVTYASGDTENSVTKNIVLATTGSSGTTVSWASDTTSVVAVDGTVVRPAIGAGDATVTLTATITKGSESDTKVFTVKVIETQSSEKSITSFYFNAPIIAAGSINESGKTITVVVPQGTDLTSLAPQLTHSGASIDKASGVAQNFSSSVTYTVTAEDGTTAEYNVTVSAQTIPELSGLGGATISASSSSGEHVPSRAIDGINTTRWAVDHTSYPAWLAVDFGSVHAFNDINFNFESSPSGGFYLEHSTDGTSWIRIGALRTSGNNFGLDDVYARYFRIYAPDGLGSSWFSIYEMALNYY